MHAPEGARTAYGGRVGPTSRRYAVQYWYNVAKGVVETDDTRGPGEDVLGPYDTPGEAARALEIARERTEKWDAEDREWNDRGAAPTWDDEELED